MNRRLASFFNTKRRDFGTAQAFANGKHSCVARLSSPANFDPNVDLEKYVTNLKNYMLKTASTSSSVQVEVDMFLGDPIQFDDQDRKALDPNGESDPSNNGEGNNNENNQSENVEDSSARKSKKRKTALADVPSRETNKNISVKPLIIVIASIHNDEPVFLSGLFVPDKTSSSYSLFLFQGSPVLVQYLFQWFSLEFDCALALARYAPVALEKVALSRALERLVDLNMTTITLDLVFSFPIAVAQAGLSLFSLTVESGPILKVHEAVTENGGSALDFQADVLEACRRQIANHLAIDLNKLSLASVSCNGMYVSCAGHVQASPDSFSRLVAALFLLDSFEGDDE